MHEHGWHAVETEGGHVGFSPIGDEERAISAWLTAQHGRTSTERLLCGKGLSEIDAVLRGASAVLPSGLPVPGDTSLLKPALRDPAEIVAAALEGHDLAARQTLARFCAVLGSVAGDCALIQGARTVVIAGGIVPRFIPFLRSSAFRERFLAKGRMATLLESVLEVTLRSACAVDAIALIARELADACVGAGTVLNARDLDAVAQAGARFAISPGATDSLYRAAAECPIPLIPGIATASELMRGLEHGWQRFKFFPAESSGGVGALQATGRASAALRARRPRSRADRRRGACPTRAAAGQAPLYTAGDGGSGAPITRPSTTATRMVAARVMNIRCR